MTTDVYTHTNANSPLDIASTLSTVYYRPGRIEEAARAVYCGVPDVAPQITADRKRLADFPLHTWSGDIPGVLGRFWVVRPYWSAACLQGHVDIDSRRGLTQEDVGLYPVVYGERDDVPVAAQAGRLDEVTGVTGLRPSLVVVSGDARPESIAVADVRPEVVRPGKSLHAYWALHGGTTREMAARIGVAIAVTLRGDPSVVDAARVMRLPGVVARLDGDVRIQTVLLAEQVAYDAADFLDRLTNLAAREGVADVDAAYRALVFAAQARKAAGNDKLPLSEADREELRFMAVTVIDARAVTREQRERYAVVMGRCTGSTSRTAMTSRNGLPTDRVELPATTMVTLKGGRVVAITDPDLPERGVPCYDPILEDPSRSRSPSARIWPGGRIFSSAGGGRTVYVVAGAQENRDADELLPGVDMIRSSTPAPLPTVDTIIGPADPAAVPDPAWEPSTEQERIGRGHTRMTMTAYWGTLADREEDRRAKAAKLDPALVAASKRTMELAREWTPLFRARFAEAGIHPPTEPCGFVQGVGDVLTHTMGALGRGCAKRLCGRCGPRLAAIQAAAAATMPVVDGNGRVVGAPMEERNLYLYEMPARLRRQWTKRLAERARAANRPLGSDTQTSDPSGRFADEPVYVTIASGSVAKVLATVAMAPSRKGGGGSAPDAEGAGRAEIREAILELALEALTPRWTRGVPDMTTGPILSETVVPFIGGGMTSSQNLHLNPDPVARDSRPHAVVVEAPFIRGVKEFAAAAASRGVASRTDATGEYGASTTVPVEDPDLRAEIWSAVQVRPPAPPPEVAVDVDADGGYEPIVAPVASPELEPWCPRDRARPATSTATLAAITDALEADLRGEVTSDSEVAPVASSEENIFRAWRRGELTTAQATALLRGEPSPGRSAEGA